MADDDAGYLARVDRADGAAGMREGIHMPDAAAQEPVRVAVCMAVFNGVRWLPEQVESILAQKNVEVTLFVSVDVSDDGSEDWIDQCARDEHRVCVLPHGRRFGHAAQNFFRLLGEIDFSGFDYVSLADQDDIWFRDKLWRAHVRLVASGADAYSSNVIARWPDGRQVRIDKAQPQCRWDHFFEAAGPGCTYVLRHEVVRGVQRLLMSAPDAMRQVGLHDWFLYAWVRAQGGTWLIDPEPSMYYRQHARNQVGVNRGIRPLLRRAGRVWSGWAMAQATLVASLVDPEEHSVVPRWLKERKMLRFALHAGDCRRRLRDRILFFLSCLLLSVRM